MFFIMNNECDLPPALCQNSCQPREKVVVNLGFHSRRRRAVAIGCSHLAFSVPSTSYSPSNLTLLRPVRSHLRRRSFQFLPFCPVVSHRPIVFCCREMCWPIREGSSPLKNFESFLFHYLTSNFWRNSLSPHRLLVQYFPSVQMILRHNTQCL